jgi:DNA-binding transcriptional LysR family regulator
MPDLRQLRAFVAVAEQLSFTRAAEVLHLQQQTVSKSIRGLEAELGVELLRRTTREVHLTDAGHALLESGRAALAATDAAFARAQQVGTGSLGRVRVAVSPVIGASDREDVVRALRADGDDVSVAFLPVRPAELGQMLREGELDLALIRASGADDPRLHRAALRPTPAVVCLPSDHRLAGCETLTVADFDGERLLLPSPPGTPFTDLLLSWFAAAGASVTPVESRITGSPGMILAQLRAERAFTIRPIGTELPDGVVAIPLAEVALPLQLVWPAGLPSAAVHRLRAAMAPHR